MSFTAEDFRRTLLGERPGAEDVGQFRVRAALSAALAGAGAGGPAVLHLFDEIGPWGTSAAEFAASLAGVRGDVELHIASPGGSATHGLAIYSQLSNRPGMVRVVVDGLAASAASIVCMAASPGQLVMSPGSMLMIHEAWLEIAAGAGELRKQADVLDTVNGILAGIYAGRSGVPESHWLAAMAAETWYTAGQAVDARLADRVGARAAAADDLVPAAAARGRAGVLAAADAVRPGHDPSGHPVSAEFKRAAYARYEQLRREHLARLRGTRNGHVAAAAAEGHSPFAKAVYGVE